MAEKRPTLATLATLPTPRPSDSAQVPLLSMQESVLLCISTLLDGSNHYSKVSVHIPPHPTRTLAHFSTLHVVPQMFELQNDKGEQLFKTIAITLVCDECAASAHPELCTHKLGSLPRWISSSKVETVRTLLSEDPAMILRETLGIAADGSNKAYSHDDVSAMMNMKPLPVRIDPRRSNENQACSADAHFSPCNNPRPTFPAYVQMYFFVAVDPSGGGPSAFSIASILLTKEAQHQVGCAARMSLLHMDHTTLVAMTSRSGVCINALV